VNERFTAKMYMDYVVSQRGITIGDLNVAPVVILSWSQKIIRSMAEATKAELSQHWLDIEQYPLYTENKKASFAHVPTGASATVAMMEELIACGAKTFVGLGFAGSLQPTASIGTCLIPTACIHEEGTSLHYVDRDTKVAPDDELVKALNESCQEKRLKVLSGAIWTTDGLYRELVSKIENYRKKGVLGVDMETSAMYALGQFRKVRVCNLLVVSDELWHEWKPAFGKPELQKAVESTECVILCSIKKILKLT